MENTEKTENELQIGDRIMVETVEYLLNKGVKAHFTGLQTVFSVESLNEHFEGLKYHEVDVLDIEIDKVVEEGAEPEKESVKFLKEGDIDFSLSTPKEVIVREYEKDPISSEAITIESREFQIEYKEDEKEIVVNESETVSNGLDIPEEDPKPVVEYPVAKAKKPKIQ